MMIDFASIFLVFSAVLAWGAREPWAMAAFSAGALLILSGKLILEVWSGRLQLFYSPVLLPVTGLFALIALQLCAPRTGLNLHPGVLPYTVEPYTTGLYLLLTVGYFALWFSVTHGSPSQQRLTWILISIAGFGVFQAFCGLAQYWGGIHSIWNVPTNDNIAQGTLENRNHYALLMNITIATGIGFLYKRTLELLRGRRLNLRAIAGMSESPKLILIVVWIALMGFSVFASQSRMGIIALFLGLGVMLVAVASAEKKKYTTVLVFLVLIGILGLALHAGIDAVLERYANLGKPGYLEGNRLSTWRDAWPMIRQTLLFGKGLGSFQWTFQAYETLQPDKPAAYAHNDYLQALAEVGTVGLGLLAWAFAACWRTAVSNLRSRDPLLCGFGLATIGALAATAAQELTDYSLCTPGVAALLLLLIAANERAGRSALHA
jgi:O-antigen ligase